MGTIQMAFRLWDLKDYLFKSSDNSEQKKSPSNQKSDSKKKTDKSKVSEMDELDNDSD